MLIRESVIKLYFILTSVILISTAAATADDQIDRLRQAVADIQSQLAHQSEESEARLTQRMEVLEGAFANLRASHAGDRAFYEARIASLEASLLEIKSQLLTRALGHTPPPSQVGNGWPYSQSGIAGLMGLDSVVVKSKASTNNGPFDYSSFQAFQGRTEAKLRGLGISISPHAAFVYGTTPLLEIIVTLSRVPGKVHAHLELVVVQRASLQRDPLLPSLAVDTWRRGQSAIYPEGTPLLQALQPLLDSQLGAFERDWLKARQTP